MVASLLASAGVGAVAGGVSSCCFSWIADVRRALWSRLPAASTSKVPWPPNISTRPPRFSAPRECDTPSRSYSSQRFGLPADGTTSQGTDPSQGCFYAFRLKPCEELKSSLLKFVQGHELKAAAVVSCVGSLEAATLRMANADSQSRNETYNFEERFEIISLVGTLQAGDSGKAPGGHLHIALSDKEGKVIGGHIVGNCKIFTTAEIVLVDLIGLTFRRDQDEATGFPELSISNGRQ